MSPPNPARQSFDRLCELETDDCVEWPFGRSRAGYGQLWEGGRMRPVHRLALERRTPAPGSNYQAMHAPLICNNRACMNYRHLRWGTAKENAADRDRDGNTKMEAAWAARRAQQGAVTHCPKGHPYDGVTDVVDRRGHRSCRTCKRIDSLRRYYVAAKGWDHDRAQALAEERAGQRKMDARRRWESADVNRPAVEG